MPFYPELGRHTPPPPPYSSGQRNCNDAISAFDTSQRSDPPPPPPPSLYSTHEDEHRISTTCKLEQTMAPDDPFLYHNSVTIPAPSVLFQVAAARPPNPGQPDEYQARNQYCESIRFGIPVEPNLVPGSRRHPVRPFDGYSLESRSEPVPQYPSLVHDQGAQSRPDYYTSTTQSLGTSSSLSQNISPYATQSPAYGTAVVDDRQPPPPTFRRYSSTTIPSLGYPNELDPPALVDPPGGAMYPPSTPARRPTLTAMSTAPRHHHHAPPARPTTDHPSQGRRVAQPNPRRPSASARFEPYKRRQSSIAVDENAASQSRPGSQVGKEAAATAKENHHHGTDSDVETDRRGEEEEEAEAEAECKH